MLVKKVDVPKYYHNYVNSSPNWTFLGSFKVKSSVNNIYKYVFAVLTGL